MGFMHITAIASKLSAMVPLGANRCVYSDLIVNLTWRLVPIYLNGGNIEVERFRSPAQKFGIVVHYSFFSPHALPMFECITSSLALARGARWEPAPFPAEISYLLSGLQRDGKT